MAKIFGLTPFLCHDTFFVSQAKREVDFLVTRNDEPWFLAEVKSSGKRGLNPNLAYFQDSLHTKHAFQVVFNMEYVECDCFAESQPVRVPAKTFLSQLV